MRRDRKLLLVVVVAFVAVAAVAGAYFFIVGVPGTLPIPAGTVIKGQYNVTFTVSGGPAQLVGAWHDDGGGLIIVIPTDQPCAVCVIHPRGCTPSGLWDETANVSLAPATYRMTVFPGGPLVVTQTIRLVYPGTSPGVSGGVAFMAPCVA